MFSILALPEKAFNTSTMVEVNRSKSSNIKLPSDELSVGETARRSGISISTLHFYEREGLVTARRNKGNQRRYARAMLRRIAIIRIAQKAGLTLAEIKDALASLPQDRVPSVRDWRRLSSAWRSAIEIQLHNLTILRDQFESCIGCGCLSLTDCPLRNPNDVKGISLLSEDVL
ncbi:MerR family transcriptional regulator [Acetobacter pasteurianus NBRC 101655]|nr:MerR family transcriptional regulator [Acetobacter pasteurianus NBRC 101655]